MCWPTMPGHEACLGMKLIYAGALHWRKLEVGILILFMSMCVHIGTYQYGYPRGSEEGVRFSGAGVTSGCVSPNMDAGDGTWVLQRKSGNG